MSPNDESTSLTLEPTDERRPATIEDIENHRKALVLRVREHLKLYEEEVEDCIEDLRVAAWEGKLTVRENHVRVDLKVIASQKAIDRFRKIQRRQNLRAKAKADPVYGKIDFDLENVAVYKQELEIANTVLQEFPERHREVFLLRMDEFTFEEIAERYGVNRVTPHRWITAIRERIQSALGRNS